MRTEADDADDRAAASGTAGETPAAHGEEAAPEGGSDAHRRRLAELLDSLLQVTSEGVRGGSKRLPFELDSADWDEVVRRLEHETEAVVRMLEQKNARAAARQRQQSKRRGIVRVPRT